MTASSAAASSNFTATATAYVTAAAQADAKTKSATTEHSKCTGDAAAPTIETTINQIALAVRNQQLQTAKDLLRTIPENDPLKERVRAHLYSPLNRDLPKKFNVICYYKSLKLQELIGNKQAKDLLSSCDILTKVGTGDKMFHEANWFGAEQDYKIGDTTHLKGTAEQPVFYLNISRSIEIEPELASDGSFVFKVTHQNRANNSQEVYKFPCSKETRFLLFFYNTTSKKIEVIEGKKVEKKFTIHAFALVNPNKEGVQITRSTTSFYFYPETAPTAYAEESLLTEFVGYLRSYVRVYRNEEKGISVIHGPSNPRQFCELRDFLQDDMRGCAQNEMSYVGWTTDATKHFYTLTRTFIPYDPSKHFYPPVYKSEFDPKISCGVDFTNDRCSVSLLDWPVSPTYFAPPFTVHSIEFTQCDFDDAAFRYLEAVYKDYVVSVDLQLRETYEQRPWFELYASTQNPEDLYLHVGLQHTSYIFSGHNGFWDSSRGITPDRPVDFDKRFHSMLQSVYDNGYCLRRPLSHSINGPSFLASGLLPPESATFTYSLQSYPEADFMPLNPVKFDPKSTEHQKETGTKEKYGFIAHGFDYRFDEIKFRQTHLSHVLASDLETQISHARAYLLSLNYNGFPPKPRVALIMEYFYTSQNPKK